MTKNQFKKLAAENGVQCTYSGKQRKMFWGMNFGIPRFSITMRSLQQLTETRVLQRFSKVR